MSDPSNTSTATLESPPEVPPAPKSQVAEGSGAAPATIPRRHDLDALRAIAMLLGILLHGAIAYIPMRGDGWPVHDPQSHPGFGIFLSVVHGFRMPLFFLISGFFTAMLWRKRGLKSLVQHRSKRIALPLLIGLFTIVPLVWAASIGAGIRSAGLMVDSNDTVWAATRRGDVDAVQSLLGRDDNTEGVPGVLNAREPESGQTALSIAAARGDRGLVGELLSSGAEVDGRNRDGTTPLHHAALLGHGEVVGLLLDRGASVTAKNRLGETPAEMVTVNGLRLMIAAGASGIELPQPPDRSAIAETLSQADPNSPAVTSNDSPEAYGLGFLVLMTTLFPLFHHLWFLWFLCWLVAAFVVYALIANALGWRAPDWLVISPLRYAWLIPLTILPQAFMGILFPSFGPDTSTGLIPMPTILAYYAIFFFFGAMYFDSDDEAGRLGRWWRLTIPIALLVVFPIGYELTTGGLGLTDDRWLDAGWVRPASVVLQVTYVWLMTFGLMGLFRSLLSRESRSLRYISDSAYWMYLAHLPLIMLGQSIVQDWPLPSLVKFFIVCVGTSVLLLISYQWLVRYTPIGTLLNGPRSRVPRNRDFHRRPAVADQA